MTCDIVCSESPSATERHPGDGVASHFRDIALAHWHGTQVDTVRTQIHRLRRREAPATDGVKNTGRHRASCLGCMSRTLSDSDRLRMT